jgi:predicted transcriptional regulator
VFTIYIHVLEVLAMHVDGADMCKIGNMGSCFSMVQIQKAVRELEKDGFITRHRTATGRVYKITEKALEYCETVVRKHDEKMRELDAMAMHEMRKKEAQEAQERLFTELVTPSENVVSEGTQEEIVGVSEEQNPLSVHSTKKTRCYWCGELNTTSEEPFCEACRSFSTALDTVKKETSWLDDIVMTSEDPDYEKERCQYCDGSLDLGEEIKSGLCLNCMGR